MDTDEESTEATMTSTAGDGTATATPTGTATGSGSQGTVNETDDDDSDDDTTVGSGEDDTTATSTGEGPMVDPPNVVHPWFGARTGSALTGDAPPERNALRPRFVWTEVPDAVTYELALTSDCPQTNFDGCDVSAQDIIEIAAPATQWRPPENLDVSMVPPMGRRYFFAMRACLADGVCSAFTDLRYIDVGRLANDFDGDGRSDFAVGSRGGSFPAPGRVDTLPDLVAEEITYPMSADNDGFGFPIALAGDLNADGYADLAIGTSGLAVGLLERAGGVQVYLGSAAGLSEIPQSLLAPTPTTNGFFGQQLAAMDVDRDGFSDLLIGHTGELVDKVQAAGAVHVYFGDTTGVADSPEQSITQDPPVSGEGYPWFGMEAIGDVDGDGYIELAIPNPSNDHPQAANAGAVFLYSGPDLTVGQPTSILEMVTPQLSAGFGGEIAGGGDLNGDGYGDLAVLASGELNGTSGGTVFLFSGGPNGLDTATQPVIRSTNPGDNFFFGSAMVMDGDVNGDGLSDLLIGEFQGAPDGNQGGTGRAFVFLGAAAISEAPDQELFPGEELEPVDWYGRAVAYGAIDGDGYADFLCTASNRAGAVADLGVAYLFRGGETAVYVEAIRPNSTIERLEFGEFAR